MYGWLRKHREKWRSYAGIACLFLVVAISVWIFIKDGARILTEFEMGRW
jgi:hypothetical protein